MYHIYIYIIVLYIVAYVCSHSSDLLLSDFSHNIHSNCHDRSTLVRVEAITQLGLDWQRHMCDHIAPNYKLQICKSMALNHRFLRDVATSCFT